MFSLTMRQTAVLILAFVITSVALITLDQRNALDPLKATADRVVGPLAASLSRTERRISSFRDGEPEGLQAQVAALTAERDQLLAENARLKQLEQEVAQLREQLGFKDAQPQLQVVPANVIGRDPDGVKQYVIIDRGSDDGIEVGMAVVSPNFFVGQVTEVQPNRARVTLGVDASYQVAAMLQESGVEGILYGRWQVGGRMELRHLGTDVEVSEGDMVVTSGKTARVPKGLIIGQVERIDRRIQADTLTLDVRPMADLSGLQSVTVILGGAE